MITWITQILSRLFVRASVVEDPLTRAGARAIAEALRLWSLDVYDPPIGDKRPRAAACLKVINDVIAAAGWGGGKPYAGNGPPQWCGMFAAKCWGVAGIDPKWFASFWASTLRMASWFNYRPWNGKGAGTRPATGARMVIRLSSTSKEIAFPDGTLPRAGDIVIVGNGDPAEGDHITLCESFDPATGWFKTVSGNGGGIGPTGERREGIVKTDYRVGGPGYRVMFVYRPGLHDLRQS